MKLPIDEVLLREPRLMVPGQMPIGAVVASTKLAENLLFCFVPSSTNKNAGARFLVSDAGLIRETRDRGVGISMALGNYSVTLLPDYMKVSAPYTLMAYFYNTSSTYWGSNNSQYFIVQYSDPNNDPWIGPGLGPISGGQLLGLYTNENGGFKVIYSGGSPSIGYHVLIGSVSSGGVAKLYLNKALIAGPTTLSTPIVKYTSTSSMLIGNTGNSTYATLLLGAMWSRELSISEIFSLSSNPTEMLIPA